MKYLKSLFVLVLSIFIMSCEDSSNSSSSDGITIEDRIRYMNFTRTQIETVDGWTLNIEATAITRQRESCSGFESAGPYDLTHTDIIYFTIISDETDYASKLAAPTQIKAYRAECGTPSQPGSGSTCEWTCVGCDT